MWIEEEAKAGLDQGWEWSQVKEWLQGVIPALGRAGKSMRKCLSGTGEEGTYMVLGTYVHGGAVGVSKATAKFPHLTELLTFWGR